jgi:hypothetical protein
MPGILLDSNVNLGTTLCIICYIYLLIHVLRTWLALASSRISDDSRHPLHYSVSQEC